MKAKPMTPRDFPPDDSASSDGTSRRGVLRLLTGTPVAVSAVAASPWAEALATLHREHDDEPASLCRSSEGRKLSRFRYHRAASFYETLEAGILTRTDEVLYHSGIVARAEGGDDRS